MALTNKYQEKKTHQESQNHKMWEAKEPLESMESNLVISQVRKLTFREEKWLSQDHTENLVTELTLEAGFPQVSILPVHCACLYMNSFKLNVWNFLGSDSNLSIILQTGKLSPVY